jgi:cob(I)alamin adenosyltransferase
LKSGEWSVGEESIARQLGADWEAIGDGFTWDSGDLDASAAIARQAWTVAKARIVTGEHRLVVLDEITYPLNWGWIDTAEVVAAVAGRPEHVSIVATGRDAPVELQSVADTVTEMRAIKHAYDQGILAMKGIDY